MKRVFPLFFCVFLILSLLSALQAVGQDLTLEPSLGVSGTYNSNYAWDRSGDELDYYELNASPSLRYDYRSHLLKVNGMIQVDVLRYLEEAQLNRENQIYFLNGEYRITETYTFSGSFSYLKDSTVSATIDRSNIFEFRVLDITSTREFYEADMGLTYQLSQASNIGFAYGYEKSDFSNEVLDDSDQHSIGLLYSRQWNDRLDLFTIRTNCSQRDSEEVKSHRYNLSFDWSHQFSRAWSLEVSLGEQYWEDKPKAAEYEDKEFFRTVGRVAVRKTGVMSSGQIAYDYRNEYTDLGGTVGIHGVYFEFQKQLTRSLTLDYFSYFYWPTDTDEDDETGYVRFSRYMVFFPTLSYAMTRNVTLVLAGNYGAYSDREARRTKVWTSVIFTFP